MRSGNVARVAGPALLLLCLLSFILSTVANSSPQTIADVGGSITNGNNKDAPNNKVEALMKQRPQRRTLQNNNNGNTIDFNDILDPDYADTVDENDPTESFLGLVSQALLLAKDYMLETDEETGDLNLNTAINGIVDDDGFVQLEIEGGYFLDMGSGSTVNLTSAGIKGLDTFRSGTADGLLQTTADGKILDNTFVLNTLVLDLYLTEFVVANGRTTESELVVRLPFKGVDVSSMPILLDLSEEGLTGFPLGAALNTTHTLPCLQDRVMKDILVQKLECTFEEIGIPTLEYSSTPSEDSPFFNVVMTLFVGLPASVPIFFNSTVRGLINDYLNNNLLEPPDDPDVVFDGPYCPVYPDQQESRTENLIDFPSFFDAGLPAFLVGFLEDEFLAVDPSTGLPKINEDLLVPMMEGLAGENTTYTRDPASGATAMRFGGEAGLINASSSLEIGGFDADFSLRVADITIQNLDTMIPPLEVLKALPEDPRLLANTLTMGLDLQDNPERSMSLSASVHLSVVTEDSGSIEHDIFLRMKMETLAVGLTALLEIAKQRLYGFPVVDILNLQCWLATLNAPAMNNKTGIRLASESFTAGIADLVASVDTTKLDVACIASRPVFPGGTCTLGMSQWGKLTETPEAQESVTEWVNDLLEWIAVDVLSDGGGILQTPIDRWLAQAPAQCPHSPSYDPGFDADSIEYEEMDALPEYEYSIEYLVVWGSLALALVLSFGGLACAVRCTVRRRHKEWVDDESDSGGDNKVARTKEQKRYLAERHRKQAEEDALQEALDASTVSMFRSSETIPAAVRWGMPFIVVGNIALFLSGHLNLGATVYIEMELLGESIRVGDFFDFAIARTAIDLWKNGGKALAMLMIIFSIVWPYTKQCLTLALWFLPPARVSVARRGSFLIWLDKLAKWSMIDIFVIVVCIAAFRVTISSPDLGFLTENFYAANLIIVPMWGLYSNMTAQLVSQVSSHFIIWYHRRIVAAATTQALEKQQKQTKQETKKKDSGAPAESGDGGDDNHKICLKNHTFLNPHHGFESTVAGGNNGLTPKNWVSSVLLALAAAIAVLLVLGSFVASFSVDLLGLLGVAVEAGQDGEQAIAIHSVWSIVALLFEEARFLGYAGDYIGITALMVLFFATIMVIPILQSLGLVYQWFVPLTKTRRRKLSVLNEILAAWQYVEVYLFAIFVASWQLGPVSMYMFNAYFESLDGFFAQMVSYGILTEADAQVFSVQGGIEPGSVALLVAAILLGLLNSVVTLASKQCLEEEYDRSANTNTSNNGISTNGSQTSGSEEEPSSELAKTPTRPLPFLFTDGYRWLLAPTEGRNGSDSV